MCSTTMQPSTATRKHFQCHDGFCLAITARLSYNEIRIMKVDRTVHDKGYLEASLRTLHGNLLEAEATAVGGGWRQARCF